MANYYEILKVSPKASRTEIKSAYRRLARKLHPDKNQGSEESARAFAQIAEAWEILGDAKSRSIYDKKLLHAQMHYSSSDGDSLFVSSNTHARRWRQMVYEHRYNEIIDRMIAEERRESLALQKIIFPTVALFVSCLVVAILRPQIFENSAVIGKIILVSLFIAGVIHLWGRIKDGLERFTYGEEIHESILDDQEPKAKPFSRAFAAGFLILGVGLSFGVGLLIGNIFQIFPASIPAMFSHSLKPEFVFYPPIFVLFVDVMHGFASRVDI